MQCANLLRKRSLQEQQEEQRRCTLKRRCLEAELVLVDHPMETSLNASGTNQQQEVQCAPAALCCPRCLGGEPGHINHMMGL